MYKKQIVLMLIALSATFIFDNVRAASTPDSLEQVLARLPDSARLIKLNDLAYQNPDDYSYKIYAEKLLKEAKQQKNNKYLGNAYFLLIKYHYSHDIDSMRLLLKEAEPVFLNGNNLEYFFRTKTWNIYTYEQQENDERVFSEAKLINKLSEQLNYPEGKEMVDQAIAHYYSSKKLFKEAFNLYEDVYKRMEARNSSPIKRINIIRQILNHRGDEIDVNKRIYYLQKLKTYIDECQENNITQLDKENPLYYIKYLYHRSYLFVAYDLGDTALMRSHLQEAEYMTQEYPIKNQTAVLMRLKAHYYILSKQYTKAIDLYNEMIKNIRPKLNRQYLIDLLYEQADMYHKIGKDDLAISQYKKCISLNDSLRRSEYLDELAKMQIQHQEDKKALKIKELQLKVSHNNLWKLGTLLIISLLTCTFFGYIIYSRKKRNRFLRKAKERAEESDRMKSAFLSNINHEIRTPLNAIIGFSEILIDEEDEEQRRQYVNIIRENNGMLQQLIDGILSISNIESGTISFKFTNFSLSELMKEIRHIAPTKIPGTTNIEYSQGPDKKIKADRSYLGQALINLLLFSASRAPKGNIRFGYKIKDDTVSFFIQNTDLEISQEEISLLLDYRLLLQRWTKGVGMGVNLELVATKTLVKRMGGDLELVSRSGQGMVIYLIIPLKPHNSQQ
ncbi:MAG: histidine kinase [Bacteroidales bacterium 43_36]|jgi:signal transduction histidine kinase|uniref:tetratricopeptide repeat-containing sensor histidine kinase n=1 Tax=Parabacteroides distasonis TaxID=823 RepID=UPI0009657C88|nr:MAG: histidine kinase [Bacteroidales bacterium 43_36]